VSQPEVVGRAEADVAAACADGAPAGCGDRHDAAVRVVRAHHETGVHQARDV
jgi:hypothetical protein